MFIVGFLVVVGAFVAVGIGGQSSGAPSFPPVAAASPEPTATARASGRAPRIPSTAAPVVTSEPGPIQLQAQRGESSMYIHGDVFIARVTWVFVSLRDEIGQVAGWASVSVPGAAGPAQGDGPTLRFDVNVAVPEGFEGPLWLRANVYDDTGALIANTGLEVGPLVRSPMESAP